MRRRPPPPLLRTLSPAGLGLALAAAGIAAIALSPHFGGPPLG